MTLLSTSLRPDTLENIQEPGDLSVDSIRLILEAERYVWFPWLSYLHPRAPGFPRSDCLHDIITNESSSRRTQRDRDRVRKTPAGLELVSQRLNVLGSVFDVSAEFQNKV